jgi:hypothetical protein
MRRRLPWLLALPLMAAGSLAAHALSYVVASARATETGAELSERTTSGQASYLVLFPGILAATALVAATTRLLLGRRCHRGREPSPWLFFALPPLAFALQVVGERLPHTEAFPFQAALEPRFLFGLLLQLPFGLLALLVARALLRVVEQIACLLARPKTAQPTGLVSWSPGPMLDLPRIPALALGYQQRGPPGRHQPLRRERAPQ